MLIPPIYKITSTIAKHLANIEATKQIVNAIPIPRELEVNIIRQSTLKSSLFSARIEGNPVTLSEFNNLSTTDRKKIEVMNIFKGLTYVKNRMPATVSKRDILILHEIVMDGLTSDLGKLRKEASAIFNIAGVAVYMPPPPMQINNLMNNLFLFINEPSEENIVIRACLSHFSFEKIHPFLDGNGRVGRLLLQAILQINGYGLNGMLSIEQYLDENREFYYKALDEKETDTTMYLEFMLEAIAKSAEKIKNIVLEKKDFNIEDSLLPRRLEILNIIRDHKLINFDQIRRRFMAVNERTLRYDLKKLIEGEFILKRGTTKGVYYEIKE